MKPVPEGYHSLNPYIAVDDASAAIEFYKRAFGARERFRMDGPEGKIGHAEIEIGDSVVMLSDPFPQSRNRPPKELGGTSMGLLMYVEDVDETVRQAIDAGASTTRPVEDMFWGDRFGEVIDPFGHAWQIATHVEDVPPDEMEERARQAMANMS
ncbi:MAG: VOC family protein [Gaiellaceae bacterium]